MKLIALLATVALVAASTVPENAPLPALEWWQSGVFYQIYPRSFKDSDGDGVGDIRGIISKLDHLKDLGVAGAWLSPIFKSPMKDHGYDIEDYYAIDPLFGTMADVRELFAKAKALNIKIILDFVPDYTSSAHEWFKKSTDRIEPYTDYYIWSDGLINETTGERSPPNNWNSVFYGHAWAWNEKRKQYYYHVFTVDQPDLNYRNPAVVAEMKKVMRFWLGKGASGFRIDAVAHLYEVADLRNETLSGLTTDPLSYDYIQHHFTQDLDEMYEMVYEWRQLADDFQMEFGGERRLLMSEAYTNSTEYPRYFKSRDNATRVGSEMPFNFVPLQRLKNTSTAADFHRIINEVIDSVPVGTRLNWVMGNHDQPRFGSRLGLEKIDAILTMILTLPGIGIIYNGEEIGMLDFRDGITWEETQDPEACNVGKDGPWRQKSRDPERTPYQWDDTKWAGFSPGANSPWLPVNSNYRELNLARQKNAPRSVYKSFKQLMELRKEKTFQHGSFESKVLSDKVFAYVRSLPGHETYAILLNLDTSVVTVDLTKLTKNFGEKVVVVTAGAKSSFNIGETSATDKFILRANDAVVVKNGGNVASFSIVNVFIILVINILRILPK